MTKLLNRIMVCMALVGASAMAHAQLQAQPHAQPPAQAAPPATRGQLLYTTHCISCHSTQMHWREKRLATDWDSLKVQVRRWQGNASLQWSEADITEVARHLNDTIYRHPQTGDRVSLSK